MSDLRLMQSNIDLTISNAVQHPSPEKSADRTFVVAAAALPWPTGPR
jgi:hypothetical protein